MPLVVIHRKRLCISSVDSSWKKHTMQPAWQSPLSGLKHAASWDPGCCRHCTEALQRVLEMCLQLSGLSHPLPQGVLALHLPYFPNSQSFPLISHIPMPKFSPRHVPLPVSCLLAAGVIWDDGKGMSGMRGHLSAYLSSLSGVLSSCPF